MKELRIVKVSEIINHPWDTIESPKWTGFNYGVCHSLSRNQEGWNNGKPRFNSYDGLYEFIAVCTSVEAAEAAKRLLEL